MVPTVNKSHKSCFSHHPFIITSSVTIMIFRRSLLATTRQRSNNTIIWSPHAIRRWSSSATETSTILFLAISRPEPNATAAGIRTASLLKHFATRFGSVHFACGASMKQKQSMSVAENVHWHHIKPNRTDDMTNLLQHIQSNHGPIRAVVFDRFYAEEAYSFRIREQCPHALRILDMQDVHSLRIGRQQLVEEFDQREQASNNMTAHLIDEVMKFDPSTHAWEDNLQDKKAHNILLRELASIHRSDLVLVCSSSEMKMLKQPSWNVKPWKLVPASFFQTIVKQETTICYNERSDFVTIGNFKHSPNVDSARLLKRIWPRIRSRLDPDADVRLHVYGAYPTNEILSMQDKKLGFYVHGHVLGINEALLNRRVMLAPLRFGAGIKGKIVDSWGCGLPAVTTPIGAEGMTQDGLDWGGLMASNEDEFVEAAVNLYTKKALWEYRQSKGLELLNKLFNKEQNLPLIDEALSDAMMNLEQRRKSDITGQLLWHQSNRSTEYFSKWIELKEVK